MSRLIYTPKGRAREYSPLALNIYNGCDHGCYYCYNRMMPFLSEKVEPKKDFLNRLMNELNRGLVTQQVLMSFSGDPYCCLDAKLQLTRSALELLQAHDVPVAILTKGGRRCLRDLDLFKEMNCKVGASLTYSNFMDSDEFEPKAHEPRERMHVLKMLHEQGIRTWVSLEPVIYPLQTLELLHKTHEFVDEYRVGKLNYYEPPHQIKWMAFTHRIVEALREYGKTFYIKRELQQYVPDLTDAEKDPDALNLVSKEAVNA